MIILCFVLYVVKFILLYESDYELSNIKKRQLLIFRQN